MANELPPVAIKFTSEGVDRVMEAFRSIEKAAASTARIGAASARVDQAAWKARGQAIKEAVDIEVRELERLKNVRQQHARAMGSSGGGGGGRSRGGAQSAFNGDKHAEEMARRHEAREDRLGSDRASKAQALYDRELSHLAGVGDVFKSAIDLAGDALKQFAGFMIADIIKPQMELGLRATQLANRLGGSVSGDQIRGTINGMVQAFAALDPKKLEEAFVTTIDKTHDLGRAQEVMAIAMKNAQAYGLDPTKVAGVVADKRATLSSMPLSDFDAFITASIAKTQEHGELGFEGYDKFSNALETLSERFHGPDDASKAANNLMLTGLLGAGSAGMKSPAKAYAGLEALVRDLDKNLPEISRVKGTTSLAGFDKVLPALLKGVGGDLTKLDSKLGADGTLGGLHLGKMNKSSIALLRGLGLDRTYQAAEHEKKGTGEQAVRDQLLSFGKPDPNAQRTAEANAKVQATAQYELEASIRRLKGAFYEMVPPIEKALIPMLKELTPKAEKAIKDLADALKGVDLVGAIKGVAQAIAGVAFYMLDIIDTFKPGGLSENQKKLRGALGNLSGVESRTVDPAEAEKLLHGPPMTATSDYHGIGGFVDKMMLPFVPKVAGNSYTEDPLKGTADFVSSKKGSMEADVSDTAATDENTEAMKELTAALKAQEMTSAIERKFSFAGRLPYQ